MKKEKPNLPCFKKETYDTESDATRELEDQKIRNSMLLYRI